MFPPEPERYSVFLFEVPVRYELHAFLLKTLRGLIRQTVFNHLLDAFVFTWIVC